MQKFLEICFSEIDPYLSNKNRFWKTKRGYCSLVCYEKKPLSVIWDSFSFSRHLYFKNMCQTGEFWDLKFKSRRWIWFSQYVTPVGKMREVIVLWHVIKFFFWPFWKMILLSLKIIIWKWWLFIVKTPISVAWSALKLQS